MEHFKKLNSLDVNGHTEKKNGLTYLSWAWAWAEIKKIYPDATYKILKNADNLPMFGNEKNGYMCYTEITLDGMTYEMWLPIMDFKNKSILQPTTFDINKTVMRCLTKNLAMFGLGLYIYAGEDMPEELTSEKIDTAKTEPKKEELITQEQVKALHTLITKTGTDPEKIKEHYKVASSKELTKKQAAEVIDRLSKKVEEAEQTNTQEETK